MIWLFESTAICLALAAVVSVTVRLAKPRPAVAHLMWLCVLLSLFAPRVVRWAVPISTAPAAVVDAEPALRAAAARSPRPFDPSASLADDRGPPPVQPPIGAAVRAAPWSTILIAGWIVGAAAVLGLAGVAAGRQHRRIRSGVAPSPSLAAGIRDVAEQLGIRSPRTRIVAGVETPFVWALGRPIPVWPSVYAARDAERPDR